MEDRHDLLNLRLIQATTEAAVLSVPQHADAHRRRASQLLDDAADRTSSPALLAEIEALRQQLELAADERAES